MTLIYIYAMKSATKIRSAVLLNVNKAALPPNIFRTQQTYRLPEPPSIVRSFFFFSKLQFQILPSTIAW